MKKIALLITIAMGVIVGSVSAMNSTEPINTEAANYVYICTGPSSKTYHISPKCNGLRNCSKEIKKVTKQQAEQMGRRPCKVCNK